jgi:hypothetical protein
MSYDQKPARPLLLLRMEYDLLYVFKASVVTCTRPFTRLARSFTKSVAVARSRCPRLHEGTNFESASTATHSQTSPASGFLRAISSVRQQSPNESSPLPAQPGSCNSCMRDGKLPCLSRLAGFGWHEFLSLAFHFRVHGYTSDFGNMNGLATNQKRMCLGIMPPTWLPQAMEFSSRGQL